MYYIVPAKADIWMAFTAPFDVEKVYIMETRHEEDLHLEVLDSIENGTNPKWEENIYRENMLEIQAKHNADFAAFFGVALALESKKPFDDIFDDYINWANLKDGAARRDKYQLTHYDGSNWSTSDYYLYKNTGDWVLTNDKANGSMKYETKWDFVPLPSDENEAPLMEKGETYTMLFPYCIGCYNEDMERDFWDYWTGKFLIFESTDGGANGHTIKGSSHVGSNYTNEWEYTENGLISTIAGYTQNSTSAVISGNPTFAKMKTSNQNVWGYSSEVQSEGFGLPTSQQGREILPTQSFLFLGSSSPAKLGTRILRDGTIISNSNQNGTTGGRIPTVGGGNDLFITSIAGGINVAVAAPQNIRVLSSTGAVIYSGYVTTAVDITLPANGIYIVSGENEVQKILF